MCAYQQNPKPTAVWGHWPASPCGGALSASSGSTSDGWQSPSTLLSAMENVVRTTYPVPGPSLQKDKAALDSVHSRLTWTAMESIAMWGKVKGGQHVCPEEQTPWRPFTESKFPANYGIKWEPLYYIYEVTRRKTQQLHEISGWQVFSQYKKEQQKN